MDGITIAAICSVLVAAFNFGGIVWQNRRIQELHDCLDLHIMENRTLHAQTQEKVATVAITDDARDIRNVGPKAIISGEHTDAG